MKSRLDETTLQKIAVDTGGVYLHATGAVARRSPTLYRDHIATMEKRELASTLERRFEQRFQIPLAIALLLLVIEPLIGERRAAGADAGAAPLPSRRAGERLRARGGAAGGTERNRVARSARARARGESRSYADGKYDEAATAYNEALVDQPGLGAPPLQPGRRRVQAGQVRRRARRVPEGTAGDQSPTRARAHRLQPRQREVSPRRGGRAAASPQKALRALRRRRSSPTAARSAPRRTTPTPSSTTSSSSRSSRSCGRSSRSSNSSRRTSSKTRQNRRRPASGDQQQTRRSRSSKTGSRKRSRRRKASRSSRTSQHRTRESSKLSSNPSPRRQRSSKLAANRRPSRPRHRPAPRTRTRLPVPARRTPPQGRRRPARTARRKTVR